MFANCVWVWYDSVAQKLGQVMSGLRPSSSDLHPGLASRNRDSEARADGGERPSHQENADGGGGARGLVVARSGRNRVWSSVCVVS